MDVLYDAQNLESLPVTIAGGEAEDGVMFIIPTAVSMTTFTASYPEWSVTNIFTAILMLGTISTAVVVRRRNKKEEI